MARTGGARYRRSMRTERRVSTPHGEARLVTHRARAPFVTLLLSHGAGGGIEARDLKALADRMPRPVSYTHLTLPTNREV